VSADEASGFGTVTACGTAQFDFEIRHQVKKGQVQPGLRGALTYTDPGSSFKKLKSTKYTSFAVSGNTATFSGDCKLKNGDPCTFDVYIEDNGTSGDVFEISINGGPFMGGVIQSGKIKIG
jgi:hypothetical protein